MYQIEELPWPVPAPLAGVKSRSKKILRLTAAELPIGGDGDANVVPVAGEVSLTLNSRVCAVGSAGKAVVALLLDGAVDPQNKANIQKDLCVLHLGPHMLAEIRPEQVAEDFVDMVGAALAGSNAQAVVLEQAKNKSPDMDTQEEEANEAWARIFGRLLRGKNLQSYKGAVVVLAAEETRNVKQACSERWGLGADGRLCQEQASQNSELEIVPDAMEALYSEDSEYSSLLEEVKQLTRQAFNEDFEEYRTESPRCWLTLLIEREAAPSGAAEEGGAGQGSLRLCGYMLHQLLPPPKAELVIHRVGVPQAFRGLRYGERLVESGIAQAAMLPESTCSWVALKAYHCLVPWYEQFGFTDMTCDVDAGPWSMTEMALKNVPQVAGPEAASAA